jgi:multiple antibiotic resistance protein
MLELLEIIGLGLMLILPLANPLTTLVLFLGLTQGMPEAEQRRQIAQTCLYVFLIMMVAFYGGQMVMRTFGISIPGLRIAGGLIVVLIGLQMLFSPQESGSSTEVEDKVAQLHNRGTVRTVNIAFVPLAMPSTAGPGTIAMLISAAAQVESGTNVTPWVLTIAPTLIFLCFSFILWLCLRASKRIRRRLGDGGIAAISRLMGFLLVCIGIQFMITGIGAIVLDLVAATAA